MADAPFVYQLVNQESWSRNIAPANVATLADAEDYIRKRLLDRYASQGFGLWLVSLADSNQRIGMAGLVMRDELPAPDLGFALLDAYVGQGLAYEAAQAVLRVARGRWSLTELYAVVKPGNLRSIQLLSRLGFVELSTDTPVGDQRLCVYRCVLV